MDSVIRKFEEIRPLYEGFTTKIHQLIRELVKAQRVDIVALESRVKTVEGFKEKIEREDKNYKNPLKEITDLSGVRIITYYNKDVDKVCEMIASEFNVDPKNSVDKRKIIEQDRFGYLSTHLVVGIGPSRASLLEWLPYKSFQCEIQVRSVLQHAWAAIDHKLRYKTEESIPSYLRRKLYRLSALLEVADDEFEAIKEISSKKVAEIKKGLKVDKLDIPIDRDSVQSYIDNSNSFRKFLEVLQGAGFAFKRLYTDSDLAGVVRITKGADLKKLEDIERIVVKEVENQSFYRSLADGAEPKKQKRMSLPAAMRLAIIGNAKPTLAKKLLKGTQFKEKLHEQLLRAKP